MANTDTVELLRECNAGTKMAVSSIDEVLEKVHDTELRDLLSSSKEKHEKLGNEIHGLLNMCGSEDKDPNPVAKGMSWIKTNWKMGMDESDSTVANLITDGCNMGVKSLNKYLNHYHKAEDTAKDMCSQLIKMEEHLGENLSRYL